MSVPGEVDLLAEAERIRREHKLFMKVPGSLPSIGKMDHEKVTLLNQVSRDLPWGAGSPRLQNRLQGKLSYCVAGSGPFVGTHNSESIYASGSLVGNSLKYSENRSILHC